AKMGMHSDYHVTWLPSYGPEMRGGAANCSVIISTEEIGSPLISHPDILLVFNLPSFDKFEGDVKAGGRIFVDSAMVEKRSERDDISAYYIPASKMASDAGLTGLANVIVLGYMLKVTGIFDYDEFLADILSGIPESKSALIEGNKSALLMGYQYGE
ncbi:MAG: 2-oxoacid:acceptor oxidoreductase family protein, partial [Firmicutes bacterium]|nr:2-oxoacid:acceptor oxidoreductase family protein [Bacillota bacterium]